MTRAPHATLARRRRRSRQLKSFSLTGEALELRRLLTVSSVGFVGPMPRTAHVAAAIDQVGRRAVEDPGAGGGEPELPDDVDPVAACPGLVSHLCFPPNHDDQPEPPPRKRFYRLNPNFDLSKALSFRRSPASTLMATTAWDLNR